MSSITNVFQRDDNTVLAVFETLDDEEAELMASIESDEWQSVPDFEDVKQKAVDAANATLSKKRRINLRLTERDYKRIQVKTIEEGIPYQTLISSIVHKYLDGQLVPASQ